MIATHGADLALILPTGKPPHPHVNECPGCDQPTMTTALVALVYTFEPCGCDHVPYTHLVETPWHRSCFTLANQPAPEPCARPDVPSSADWWVLVEFNQASGVPSDVEGIYHGRDSAEESRAHNQDVTDRIGRRDTYRTGYVVFTDPPERGM